jgi:hypothetical protein
MESRSENAASFKMSCWSRMEEIIWALRLKTEEVLNGVKAERNTVPKIQRWKANWIGHILRRNCLLKHTVEGKIEGDGEKRKNTLPAIG